MICLHIQLVLSCVVVAEGDFNVVYCAAEYLVSLAWRNVALLSIFNHRVIPLLPAVAAMAKIC